MSSGNVLINDRLAAHRELNKILILTVSAGDGHTRAAQAVERQFKELYPNARVEIVDTFRYASPLVEKMVRGAYLEIIKISPMLYGYLYYRAEKDQPLSRAAKLEFNRITNKLAAPKLISLINSFQPQVVLCTHPFPLGILSTLKLEGKLDIPVMAAVTDFTVHPFWIHPGVDYYCIAAEELKPAFIKHGVSTEKVVVTGIPIDPEFNRIENKDQLKKKLKLKKDVPAILVMGGGLGMGPLEDVVKVLGRKHCQLLVVCGRNNALKKKIEETAEEMQGSVYVYGFVRNIHEIMGASDLMVTKAGGLSCSEAVALGLPLFITKPIPGQEERNTEFLVSQGAAVAVKNHKQLLEKISTYLQEPVYIRNMSKAARKIGRANSAKNVVELMRQAVLK